MIIVLYWALSDAHQLRSESIQRGLVMFHTGSHFNKQIWVYKLARHCRHQSDITWLLHKALMLCVFSLKWDRVLWLSKSPQQCLKYTQDNNVNSIKQPELYEFHFSRENSFPSLEFHENSMICWLPWRLILHNTVSRMTSSPRALCWHVMR